MWYNCFLNYKYSTYTTLFAVYLLVCFSANTVNDHLMMAYKSLLHFII